MRLVYCETMGKELGIWQFLESGNGSVETRVYNYLRKRFCLGDNARGGDLYWVDTPAVEFVVMLKEAELKQIIKCARKMVTEFQNMSQLVTRNKFDEIMRELYVADVPETLLYSRVMSRILSDDARNIIAKFAKQYNLQGAYMYIMGDLNMLSSLCATYNFLLGNFDDEKKVFVAVRTITLAFMRAVNDLYEDWSEEPMV